MSTGICSACSQVVEYYKGRRCRECVNAWAREHYAKSGEKARKIKRDHMARMRQDPERREKLNARKRELYHEEGYAEKAKAHRQAQKQDFFAHRARIFRYRNKVAHSKCDFEDLWQAQDGRCALTGWSLDESAEIDHILPIARGGGHELTNLRWVCSTANRAKRDLTDDEFLELILAVMTWMSRVDQRTQ